MIIGIVPNFDRDSKGNATYQIISELNKLNCQIVLESSSRKVMNEGFIYTENIYSDADIIIAVGGDATIIRAAKFAAYYDKPVLGVNNGTLGYMAAIELNELNLLSNLIDGQYSIEQRMIIKVITNSADTQYCLNDLVLKNTACSGLAKISLFNDSKLVMSFSADGAIVSTPTGSTAYSLSAGGPITDPTIDCMIMTPICAHSMAARSVILSPRNKFCLRLVTSSKYDNNFFISAVFDGIDSGVRLKPGEEIHFERSDEHAARLIKIKNQSFYDILKNKLNNM